MDNSVIAYPRLDVAQPLDNPATLVKFHNVQSLMCSASSGCHMCTLLLFEMSDIPMLLDELAEQPEVAWDQTKILIWRYNATLIVRLLHTGTNGVHGDTLAELKYIEPLAQSMNSVYLIHRIRPSVVPDLQVSHTKESA